MLCSDLPDLLSNLPLHEVRSLESVRETSRCLAKLAHSLPIPFEFHPVGERLETLKPYMLNRRIGEALAVNSVNRLHQVPVICLGNLLMTIQEQAPVIVTLVEQEASHNRTYFLSQFLKALHYYSAIFDSLDATFPLNSMEQTKVEQYIFTSDIKNISGMRGSGEDREARQVEEQSVAWQDGAIIAASAWQGAQENRGLLSFVQLIGRAQIHNGKETVV